MRSFGSWTWLIIAPAIILGAWLAARGIVTVISQRPDNLGVRDGQLAPCQPYPNGVCSQASDEDEVHAIAPIPFQGSPQEAKERIIDILQDMPRMTLVASEPHYVHAELKTAGFGYIDDVEFLIDEKQGVIHFRSSARVPYYDFQVNRKRMEEIRAAFERR